MRNSFIILFLALLSGCLAGRIDKRQVPLGPQLDQQRFEAMIRRDTILLKRILHDDLIYTHSNGLVETKQDFIRSIHSAKIQYKKLRPTEQTYSYRDQAIVSSGIVEVAGRYREKDFDIQLRFTSCYFKNDGMWQLIAWQSLKI